MHSLNQLTSAVRRTTPEPLTAEARVETYLSGVSHLSTQLSDDFRDPHLPIANTLALIPVAAHSEAGNIGPAMREYAKQRNCSAFTVALLLNYPFGADENKVEETIAKVEQAKTAFPHLDIRYTTLALAQGTKIGAIRKTLWDAVLRVAADEGAFEQGYMHDVLGINHDIDTEAMSPRYIKNIQDYYELYARRTAGNGKYLKYPLESRYTQVSHGLDMQRYPNISKAVWLDDFAQRQYSPHGVYEEGLVVPLTRYVYRGGFHSVYSTHETRWLSPAEPKGIPGTSMKTSMRRFVDRLDAYGFNEIWTDRSFGMNDPCREERSESDITADRLEDLLKRNLRYHFDLYARNSRGLDLDELEFTDGTGEMNTLFAIDPAARLSEDIQWTADRMKRVANIVLGSNSQYERNVQDHVPIRVQETLERFERFGIKLTPKVLSF